MYRVSGLYHKLHCAIILRACWRDTDLAPKAEEQEKSFQLAKFAASHKIKEFHGPKLDIELFKWPKRKSQEEGSRTAVLARCAKEPDCSRR